ncbi:hypothetical protein GQ43DRAFT_479694 [Delitschia confertaspora ATCC 74209]|uniref:Uncharacterized protein n=1 Tax=Delitschia confertaspora ATCC 74209 TaxID=1513339 RepID=A0A9P4JNS4_9PLEO|nr:hypothetical protein GQ43DRAFT_479694 [Delitschia confertaspora ATCC 74209]
MAPIMKAFSLFLLSSLTSAYWIDPETCGSLEKGTEVLQAAFESAKTMIQDGAQLLADRNNEPKINDLAKLVFGTDQSISGALQFFSRVARSISTHKKSINKDAIRLYCGDSFLDVDLTINPNMPMTYDFSNDDWIAGKQKLSGNDDHAFTYSDTVTGTVKWSAIVMQPNDIVIWRNNPTLTIDRLIAHLISTGNAKNGGRDHADNICVGMDAIMAHELFHSVLAMNNGEYNTRAVDIKDGNGNDIGYEWGSIRGRAQDGQGYRNADSLAYFACLASLVKKLDWEVDASGALMT